MRKLTLALCGFFLLSTLTGCIDYFEEYIFNENGSGHVHRKIDMSKTKEMIDMLGGLAQDSAGSTSTSKEAESLDKTDFWKNLENMEGISNVKIISDTAKYIYTVDFDFKDEAALNRAMKDEIGDKNSDDVFSIENSSISRSSLNSFGTMLEKEGNEDEETLETMKSMYEEMKYSVSITVPGKIKSVSGKGTEVSSDKKTVKLETNLKELMEEETSLKMKIDYKK